MKELVALLQENKLCIASIESVSAGLFAATMADVAGASAVLKGALVTYQTSSKIEVLHIEKNTVETYGVISEEVACAMALRGYEMFASDVVVSCTGNAGPSALEGKEVGRVYMSIYYQGHTHTFSRIYTGGRRDVREQCVDTLVQEVKHIIKNQRLSGF